MSKIIGAVEIGTSHAKVLIGEVGENKKLSIVGMEPFQRGNEKRRIIDFRSVATCVHSAIEEAEKCLVPRLILSIWLKPAHISKAVLRECQCFLRR